MMKPIWWICVVLCFTVTSVFAQDEACPALLDSALDYTDQVCSATERNQACYGNLQVNATPAENVTDFKFDAPGDIENVMDIAALRLSEMQTPDTWGIMLMQIQATLPDTLPGQNITMLLFGNVSIENQGGATQAVLLEATASGNARVRSGPGTQNSQMGSLKGGDVIQVDGRNEAGDWLRVVLGDGTAGWVSGELLQLTDDAATLSVVEGTEMAGTAYGPMQAFYFTSGVGAAACDEAPPDGILIQTPEGAGKIDLLINEVQISVGSTIFITAQASGEMRVHVLEGVVTLTAAGTTIVVPPGAVGFVPLDEKGIANGAPTLAGYVDAVVAPLAMPVTLLPQAIEIAAGLTEEALNTPRSGRWQTTIIELRDNSRCDWGINVGDTGIRTLIFDRSWNSKKTGENTYTFSSDGGTVTYVFTSSVSATYTVEEKGECAGMVEVDSLTYIGE